MYDRMLIGRGRVWLSVVVHTTRRFLITCTIIELTNKTCKWPIGNPAEDDFHFCGASAPEEGRSYCALHMEMAYRHNYVSQSQRQKNKRAKKAA